MTLQKAVEQLVYIRDSTNFYLTVEDRTALDIGIEALREIECQRKLSFTTIDTRLGDIEE